MAVSLPRHWAQELLAQTDSAELDDGLLDRDDQADVQAAGRVPRVRLSYSPKRFAELNIDPDDVAANLSAGLLMERRPRGSKINYRLIGSAFTVPAFTSSGDNTGTRTAYVPRADEEEVLAPRDLSWLRAEVTLHPVWDEEYCDLDRLYADHQRFVRRAGALRTEIDRGGGGLDGHLARRVNRFYAPLRALYEVFDTRLTETQAVSLHGRVQRVISADQPVGQLDPAGPELARILAAQGSGDVLVVAVTEEFGTEESGTEKSGTVQPGRPVRLTVPGTGLDSNPAWYLGRDDNLVYLRMRRIDPAVLGCPADIDYVPRGEWQEQRKALEQFLAGDTHGSWEDLARLMVEPRSLWLPEPWPVPEPERGYNAEQEAAVAGAVHTPHTFFVQGPPGTGKTTVIEQTIRQLVARGERVLLVAPMNVAVDEVVRRIGDEPGVLAVRVAGQDSKVAENVQRFLSDRVRAEFLRRLRRRSDSRQPGWRAEIDEFTHELAWVDHWAWTVPVHRDAGRTLDELRVAVGKRRANAHLTLAALTAKRRRASAEAQAALVAVDQATERHHARQTAAGECATRLSAAAEAATTEARQVDELTAEVDPLRDEVAESATLRARHDMWAATAAERADTAATRLSTTADRLAEAQRQATTARAARDAAATSAEAAGRAATQAEAERAALAEALAHRRTTTEELARQREIARDRLARTESRVTELHSQRAAAAAAGRALAAEQPAAQREQAAARAAADTAGQARDIAANAAGEADRVAATAQADLRTGRANLRWWQRLLVVPARRELRTRYQWAATAESVAATRRYELTMAERRWRNLDAIASQHATACRYLADRIAATTARYTELTAQDEHAAAEYRTAQEAYRDLDVRATTASEARSAAEAALEPAEQAAATALDTARATRREHHRAAEHGATLGTQEARLRATAEELARFADSATTDREAALGLARQATARHTARAAALAGAEQRLDSARLRLATRHTELDQAERAAGEARDAAAKARDELDRAGVAHLRAAARDTAADTELATVSAEITEQENRDQATLDAAERLLRQARDAADEARRRARDALGAEPGTLPDGDVAIRCAAKRSRIWLLSAYVRLEEQWFTLTGQDDAGELATEVERKVQNALVQATNVVCATTVGIGLSPFAKHESFDTLIVDEASRVTDSEFLIGAVRSRRWVLVGDEKQLPPFVDQQYENHVHALSALRLIDQDTDPEAALDLLAQRWAQDEDTRVFRRDAVADEVGALTRQDRWATRYREPYRTALTELATATRNTDPERSLLTALSGQMVRSLFERSISPAPAVLRQPLIEQRRMVDDIAALVRDPIYGGDYRTPSDGAPAPLVADPFPQPVTFLDTSLQPDFDERQAGNGFVNPLEQRWVSAACRIWNAQLAARRVDRVTVSILSFYRAQAIAIRAETKDQPSRFPHLDFQVVDAIDKIQGQESDLVIISFCRTRRGRPSAQFGLWLQDLRRINVAVTRARRALLLVGHRPTLAALHGRPQAQEFYRNLFARLDATDRGVIRDFDPAGRGRGRSR